MHAAGLADRLALLEQGQVQAASAHLTIRIYGIPAVKDAECVSAAVSTQPAECDQKAVPGASIVVNAVEGGQRVPDWQLDSTKNKLTQTVLGLVGNDNAWRLYSALTQPQQQLDGMAPIDHVTPNNVHAVAEIVSSSVV